MPNIINLCEKNKKSLGRTRFGPDARTDRVITIGRSPQSGGVLINNHFRHQWWNIKMPRTRWQFVTVKSLIWPWGQSSHCLEVVYLLAKYEKPILNDKKVTARTRFVMDARTSLTVRSKFKVKGHQQWYATHRLEVIYLHAKYANPVLNDKKVTDRTRFVTNRLITIGHPP